MKTTQSRVLLAISVLGVLYFSMYLPISGQGARDLNMLMLRQVVSILPMLLSAGLLVYMQTGFK